MQVHDLPLSVALTPDIGFLKVLIPHPTFSGAGFAAQYVTPARRISARVYLHMHVGPSNRFDSPTTLDESSPHFLVLRQVGTPFRKPLCEVRSVVSKVGGKIVGGI